MKKLSSFHIISQISNIDFQSDPDFIQELEEILRKRPHLRLGMTKIVHDNVEIDIYLESIDKIHAHRQMAEELFEVTMAILNKIDDVKITVLQVDEE